MKKAKLDLFGDVVEKKPLCKAKKVKKAKNQDTNISKEFLEHYKNRYNELFEVSARINWGKDLKLLNSLLKTYNDPSIFNCETKLEFLVKACEKFFLKKDPFFIKGLWSIGCFYSSIDSIVLSLQNSDRGVIDSIIGGYKLAFLNHTGDKCEEIFIEKEEVFGHIYLIIKGFWMNEWKKFSLTRFAELYFLVSLCYSKKQVFFDLNFFISKFAQDKFQNWIETEGKEIIEFLPKEVGKISEEDLDTERKKILEEEKELFDKNIERILWKK